MSYRLEKLVLLDLVTTVSVTSCTATVALKIKTKIKFHHPAMKKDHHLKARKEEKYERKKTFQRNPASETKTKVRLSLAV